jgi:hypothetical protein
VAEWGLTAKEGWQAFCDRSPVSRPEHHSLATLRALGEDERGAYNLDRSIWHANLGPFKTPSITAIHAALERLVRLNMCQRVGVRRGAVLEGPATVGKSTTLWTFGRQLHRELIAAHGQLTPEGHEHIPVCYASLTGASTIKGLMAELCTFYNDPLPRRQTADDLTERFGELVRKCRTRLVVIDDLHFLRLWHDDGQRVNDQLKYLQSVLPATFLLCGIDLKGLGLFHDGHDQVASGRAGGAAAQNGRRLRHFRVKPFQRAEALSEGAFGVLVASIERELVLGRSEPGMLSDQADYLWRRCTGHIGSLMALVAEGCELAIGDGAERLTRQVLDRVVIDEDAETLYRRPAP